MGGSGAQKGTGPLASLNLLPSDLCPKPLTFYSQPVRRVQFECLSDA